MSTSQERELLKVCERGELQTIRELVENKVVDPSRVIDQSGRYCRGWPVNGWTPLHFACL